MTGQRALVVYGSKRGGTAGIATTIAETLRADGLDVDCGPASETRDVTSYDVIVIGGGLYMRRWVREARRFVSRHAAVLRTRPVWMFSSGPLDDSAAHHEIPPVPKVGAMMDRIGARGHATFGGRLERDAHGFVAAAMAKKSAGDWRDREAIRSWAHVIARDLVVNPGVTVTRVEPSRWPLVALCLATGFTAMGGGVALVAKPDGGYVHMPTSALAHSPFSTFLIPGLVLMLVVGAGSLVAGVLVARHHARAGLVAGAVLFGWITSEMAMLRTIHPFHLTYLAIAVAMMLLAMRRWNEQCKPVHHDDQQDRLSTQA